MNREELEILIARHFDGDLSSAEKELLMSHVAADRELAELFSEQEVAHRNLETLKLRWALPADFSSRVVANLPATSEFETLIARYFDGDLSTAEKEQLEREIAAEPELASLFNDQELAHRDLESLKLRWTLPADFTSHVMAQLPGAPAFDSEDVATSSFNWRSLAMAASILLVMGLMLGVAYVNRNEGLPAEGVATDGKATKQPIQTPSEVKPLTSVFAYSTGDVRIADAGSITVNKSINREIALPADIAAPADTHAVVKIGNGTAVLSPGARARFTQRPEGVSMQPLDGDIYMEADADSVMDAQVSDVSVSVEKGGMTLRRRGCEYFAEPSHGNARLRHGLVVASMNEKQFAVIQDNGAFSVQQGSRPQLDNWAAAGRADELKRHVAKLAGVQPDDLNLKRWNSFIAGLAAKPQERATNAAFMRIMLDSGLLNEISEEEINTEARQTLVKIIEILEYGTRESDIPPPVRLMLKAFEKNLTTPEFRSMIKDHIRRFSEECEKEAQRQQAVRQQGEKQK